MVFTSQVPATTRLKTVTVLIAGAYLMSTAENISCQGIYSIGNRIVYEQLWLNFYAVSSLQTVVTDALQS